MQCGPMSPHVTGTPEFGGLGEGWWDGNRADPEQCSPNTNKRSATPNKCSDLPNKCSGTKHQEPNTWYLVPGTRYRVPGTRYLVLGTRYSTRTSVQVFRTSAFRCSEQRTLNTNTEQSEQCSASALDGNNGLYWKARAWWCGIRRIREGQNSGTWHDLVPGTIRYLARSGTWHDLADQVPGVLPNGNPRICQMGTKGKQWNVLPTPS
jgi:hypothetical protein